MVKAQKSSPVWQRIARLKLFVLVSPSVSISFLCICSQSARCTTLPLQPLACDKSVLIESAAFIVSWSLVFARRFVTPNNGKPATWWDDGCWRLLRSILVQGQAPNGFQIGTAAARNDFPTGPQHRGGCAGMVAKTLPAPTARSSALRASLIRVQGPLAPKRSPSLDQRVSKRPARAEPIFG